MSIDAGSGGVAPFRVDAVDYAASRRALHAVRDAVFVNEQQVPVELEHDALDPGCVHVLARTLSGEAIGTARLAPPRADGPAKLGRMAVLAGWRGRGVGAAMLRALVREARQRGWHEVVLHAQVPVVDFYARHGFAAEGPRFMEAGIEHQAMRLAARGAVAVSGPEDAAAMVAAIALAARRQLCLHLREAEPVLLEAAPVLQALRRFAVAGHGGEARILLQHPAARLQRNAALLSLAQRMPSAFAFRAAVDPVDTGYPSAYVVNDAGGYCFRPLADRFEGEADLASPGRARQLRAAFAQVWERSRPLTEFRALRL